MWQTIVKTFLYTHQHHLCVLVCTFIANELTRRPKMGHKPINISGKHHQNAFPVTRSDLINPPTVLISHSVIMYNMQKHAYWHWLKTLVSCDGCDLSAGEIIHSHLHQSDILKKYIYIYTCFYNLVCDVVTFLKRSLFVPAPVPFITVHTSHGPLTGHLRAEQCCQGGWYNLPLHVFCMPWLLTWCSWWLFWGSQ